LSFWPEGIDRKIRHAEQRFVEQAEGKIILAVLPPVVYRKTLHDRLFIKRSCGSGKEWLQFQEYSAY